MPKSLVGHRDMNPPAMSAASADAYSALVRKLLNLEPTLGPGGRVVPAVLHLSDAANDAILAFPQRLEPRLAEDGDLHRLSDWAGKLASQVLRVATLITIVDNANTPGADPLSGDVSAQAMCLAIELGEDYLLSHAAACIWEKDPYEQAADAIVGWLLRKPRIVEFKQTEARRQVARLLGRRGASYTEAALDLLVEHRYLRWLPKEKRSGRPSPSCSVNPDWARSA